MKPIPSCRAYVFRWITKFLDLENAFWPRYNNWKKAPEQVFIDFRNFCKSLVWGTFTISPQKYVLELWNFYQIYILIWRIQPSDPFISMSSINGMKFFSSLPESLYIVLNLEGKRSPDQLDRIWWIFFLQRLLTWCSLSMQAKLWDLQIWSKNHHLQKHTIFLIIYEPNTMKKIDIYK